MPDNVDRFDAVVDAVHDLQAAASALETAKRTLEDARERVCVETAALLPAGHSGEPTDPKIIALVRHLYWTQPDVPAQRLADAVGFRGNALNAAIGPTASGIECAECSCDIPRTSRSWTPKTRGYRGAPICVDCDRANDKKTQAAHALRSARRAYAAAGSVAAPAWEWIVAVELLRAYPPVATGIEPGSDMDRATGTWRDYDSSIYVGRIVDALRGEPNRTATVPQAPARVLLAAAQNVAAWDSARACELTERFTKEAPGYVLARLQARIDQLADARQGAALERFPDDSQPDSTDYGVVQGDAWRREVRELHSSF